MDNVFDTSLFNKSGKLAKQEIIALKQLAEAESGINGWPSETQKKIRRLITPILKLLKHLGTDSKSHGDYGIRSKVTHILIKEMHKRQTSYWAFSKETWLELCGPTYYDYIGYHGIAVNARQQIIGVSYLFGGFDEVLQLGRLAFYPLAEKIFGKAIIESIYNDFESNLLKWGYAGNGTITSLKNALGIALITNKSSNIQDLNYNHLLTLYKESNVKHVKRGLVLISHVLVKKQIIGQSLGRDGRNALLKEEILHKAAVEGVSKEWLSFAERWYKTSSKSRTTRIGIIYRIIKVGRWLEIVHPEIVSPNQWDTKLAAEYVGVVTHLKIGEFERESHLTKENFGKPQKASSKASMLNCLRTFFTDCQEWDWINRNFNPKKAFATPSTIRAKLGPDPRVIADDFWAKLMWAGLNLQEEDIESNGFGVTFYSHSFVKALALLWLFSGLRRDEILRLRVGCIRWQEVEIDPLNSKKSNRICLLDIPINKTSKAFTKPLDGIVGEAIEKWEIERGPQQFFTDEKTGEVVQYLFTCRGKRLGSTYLNATLIPLLCKKAGIPTSDVKGKITGHRARATIATQLFNAKDPLSLLELMEWLGHSSPDSTKHYAKTTPNKLTKLYEKAGYFKRNLRAIEVLIDQDVIKSGAAGTGEPWRYYDLGHGYCSYDFFDQCAHRMACAKCSFYTPKDSAKSQLLEGKSNLQRLLQQIPLTDEERLAVEDGVEAMTNLCKRLESVPTPDGLIPKELNQKI